VTRAQPERPEAGPPGTIQAVTPTLCRLLGVNAPALCAVPPLNSVLGAAHARFGHTEVERCLVYAPDAIGNHLQAGYPGLFTEIARLAPLAIPVRSVFPPKTPVCFASMFTGASPADHGIRQYEQPVLRCDTLFDALVRAGRRVAIVAVADSSIDRIFRGRDLDYFSERYDPEVTARAIALIEAGRHEFILVYHQEYDDLLHETTPFSEGAIRAFRHHVAAFGELVEAADTYWLRHDRAIVFAPDHGAHVDPKTMTGTHGEDSPEDMELTHFYSLAGSGQATEGPPRDFGGDSVPDHGGGKMYHGPGENGNGRER
jgi:hypothetical protein